ncbi:MULTISPECIES: RNA polymerase sigma factor [Virgibacillus]|uniref:RNA polymerase n=1 Tax=Virgibacillus pantothenticus TaxID=1473 RepID=A0A0L0QRG9_VIRPA|nr:MULTISPECIES: sigma-70 family RNA polymerase sigma factor [Virgibacillus]API92258.1 RNA polymerase [Virgibacillus sp. 6R]KNE21131.1 RNA polymerase [Virgibacillus pantothenticus]MBS7427143.1 sigma-70 family RNA polymerase sigma factor [Virgibacillus sp. 19R1-5]MBU8567502.1 sigma-70 family RNA polymerase sigma factor [Virgibacillus pantothenticus]MBU8601136.1 sigma-70 family RNA polymerase sigma factor [Virgibacillus pantothenticus]
MKGLIKKAQNSDEKAFAKIFEKYEADLYKVAYVYVGNQDAALDVIQETAYRSFKSIKFLKESQYLKTWLIKIAINCSIDYIRSQTKNKIIDIDKLPLVNEDSRDFTDNIDWKITLNELIQQLEPAEKTVIILRFYNDLTIKQVAKLLEIPLGTVKTILYRALKKLKNNMKGESKLE